MCHNTSYLRVEWLLKYFFDCKGRAWELVNNIKMFCGKSIYFVYNGLLSWWLYWRAVTGSRLRVMYPGYLGIQEPLQRPPRDLDLSSEGLISWAAVYWAYHISPSKWKCTNDLYWCFCSIKAFSFTDSFEWILDLVFLLFFCLKVWGTVHHRFYQFHILVHPASWHLVLGNRIPEYFFLGKSDPKLQSGWKASPMPSGPISIFPPSFW